MLQYAGLSPVLSDAHQTLARPSRYVKHPDAACRTVDGRAVAVTMARADRIPALFSFNETGTVIWDLLDEQPSLPELLDRLAALYPDASSAERDADTLALLSRLIERGIVLVRLDAAP